MASVKIRSTMSPKLHTILIFSVIAGCDLLRDNHSTNTEPDGWFVILSDSTVSFDDDEQFEELLVQNLYFLDERRGWVTGSLHRDGPDFAFAASTSNGGKSWAFNFIDDYTRAGDPHFFDMKRGILAGNVIHRTTDGGNTWTHRMIQSGEPPVGVTTLKFQNPSIGWASGPFGAVAKTTDSGITWSYLDLGFDEDRFESISIVGNHVWLLGEIDPGRLIKTSDGGLTWQTIQLPSRGAGDPFFRFDQVHFVSESKGWVVGDFRHIYHTTDGGTTWTLQYPLTEDQIDDDTIISFDTYDGQIALALTNAGAILSTKNGGQTWDVQMPKNNNSINSKIQFISKNVVFAINGNRVLKTVTGGSFLHDAPLRSTLP